EVHANGHGPFQFAIDTGTSTTAIAPELAQQLGLEGSPVGPLTTGGARVNVTAGTLKSFQIGGARIDDLVVVVADFFSVLSQAVGARLDGIVGYNFLRNFRVVIDYPGEKFRLEETMVTTLIPAQKSTERPPAILSLIGDTPLVEVTRIDTGPCHLFLKLENQNPTGSIKDRVALAMVEAAERDGQLAPGGTIIEATAGNTGLGLALVAAAKGYRIILVIPDKMSE